MLNRNILNVKLYRSMQGRIGRQTYLLANGVLLAISLITFLIYYGLSSIFYFDSAVGFVFMFISVIVFVIAIAAHLNLVTKRFHDLNLSGWVVFITVVIGAALSLVGIVLVILVELWLMFRKGTNGANKFGDDPLLAEGIAPTELTSSEINPNTLKPIKSVTSSVTSDESTKKLEKLKDMLDKGLISEQDYETKKAEVLSRM